MYFPKREEFSFRRVLAFPSASSTGIESRTCRSTFDMQDSVPPAPAKAKKRITNLVVSVLPAPLSPETNTVCPKARCQTPS
eukprot:Skav223850  [mRNA]  locus=scaffold2304:390000:390242:+ [translate_table: standard]